MARSKVTRYFCGVRPWAEKLKRPCAPARSSLKLLGPYLQCGGVCVGFGRNRLRLSGGRPSLASQSLLLLENRTAGNASVHSGACVKAGRIGTLPCGVLNNHPQGEAGSGNFKVGRRGRYPARPLAWNKNQNYELVEGSCCSTNSGQGHPHRTKSRRDFNKGGTIVKSIM